MRIKIPNRLSTSPVNRRRSRRRPTDGDAWLARGSHIAQVGLFVLTLWTLFYTVIPLYKTAALEEQIARREAELKAAEQKLTKTEANLAQLNDKVYRRNRAEVLWNLYFRAGPSCSGLLREPEQFISLDAPPPPKRPLLAINVADCLADELAKTNAKSLLQKSDLDYLHAAVMRVSQSLEARRAQAQEELRQMEFKSTAELHAVAPVDPHVEQLKAWIAKVQRADPRLLKSNPQRDHAEAVRNAQEKIERDFEAQVRIEIGQLQALKWPPAVGNK